MKKSVLGKKMPLGKKAFLENIYRSKKKGGGWRRGPVRDAFENNYAAQQRML